MQVVLDELKNKFKFRDKQIEQLIGYYNSDDVDEYLIDNLFVYGSKNTGKTIIVKSTLELLKHVRYSIINLSICYTNRHLFQKILRDFQQPHNPNNSINEFWNSDENEDISCNNIEDFLKRLQTIIEDLLSDKCIVIVFDNAEFLRNDDFVLNIFLRLKEFVNCNSRLSVIWISNLVPEQFFSSSGTSDLILGPKIFFNSYSKNELLKLLVSDCPVIGTALLQRTVKQYFKITKVFIEEYVGLIVNIYYTNCNDLKQLEFISNQLFPIYCKPLVYATTETYNIYELFKAVVPYFEKDFRIDLVDTFAQEKLKCTLKCPRIVRYLIVSAYLASRISAKDDCQYFDKYTKRKSKAANKSQLNASRKVGKTFEENGPKSFTYFRLMGIFKAICLEEDVEHIDYRSLIKHLVEIKVLSNASTTSRSDLSQQNFKCILNYDYVFQIAESINLNLNKYLRDL